MSINRLPSENKASLLPSPTTRQVQRSEALDVTRIVTRVVTVQRPTLTWHLPCVTTDSLPVTCQETHTFAVQENDRAAAGAFGVVHDVGGQLGDLGCSHVVSPVKVQTPRSVLSNGPVAVRSFSTCRPTYRDKISKSRGAVAGHVTCALGGQITSVTAADVTNSYIEDTSVTVAGAVTNGLQLTGMTAGTLKGTLTATGKDSTIVKVPAADPVSDMTSLPGLRRSVRHAR
ncbi:hypothetical protein C0Q70_14417 [Pomacea canaliculata]|uniref:Uncharacterized protein n=1 Tax=Pomacea canaliculata TaxID=400727 RepID=A0A2T7NZZ6_POMCA|nr:hypothetical protein C0Q70_14417 [Pomacea canaliculata]